MFCRSLEVDWKIPPHCQRVLLSAHRFFTFNLQEQSLSFLFVSHKWPTTSPRFVSPGRNLGKLKSQWTLSWTRYATWSPRSRSSWYPNRNQSQGPSRALAPGSITVSPGSDSIRKGKMARLKNLLFNRSSNSIAHPSIGVRASVQMELSQAFHGVKGAAFMNSLQPHNLQQSSTQVAPAHEVWWMDFLHALCYLLRDCHTKITIAQQELNSAMLVPPVAQHTVRVVGGISTAVLQIDTISSTYLQPLKTFNTVVSTIANVWFITFLGAMVGLTFVHRSTLTLRWPWGSWPVQPRYVFWLWMACISHHHC